MYMYMYMHMHMYVYTHTRLYVYICIYSETRKRLPNAGFPQWAHGWTTDGQYTRDVDLGMGRRKGSDLGMWKACYFCRCMATKDDATGCGTARHETRRQYEKTATIKFAFLCADLVRPRVPRARTTLFQFDFRYPRSIITYPRLSYICLCTEN